MSKARAEQKTGRIERCAQLFCAALVLYGLCCRLLPLLWYGETINEFDPWFNFRVSAHVRERGLASYFAWKDTETWVPRGRNIAETTFPLFALCSNAAHVLLDAFVPFALTHYQVCCLMPVFYFACAAAVLCALCGVLFERAEKRRTKTLLSLGLFAVSGGFFEKTVSGAFDYEGLSLLLALSVLLVYVRHLRSSGDREGAEGRGVRQKTRTLWLHAGGVAVLQSLFAATWGGSVFTELLLVLHALAAAENSRFLLFHTLGTLAITSAFPFVRAVNVALLGKLAAAAVLEGAAFARHARRKHLIAAGVLAAPLLCGSAWLRGTEAAARALQLVSSTKAYNLLVRNSKHPLVASISEHGSPSARTALALGGLPFSRSRCCSASGCGRTAERPRSRLCSRGVRERRCPRACSCAWSGLRFLCRPSQLC